MIISDKIGHLSTIIYILLFQVFISSGSYAQTNIAEEIYFHSDRPFYLTGETIWYKIYNTNYHKHSDHSEVVYVNVHEKKGRLLLQQKLRLNEGTASGSIDIPLSWNEDYYYITYFTKWNLQFGHEGLSINKIPIYNIYEDEKSGTMPLSDQADSNEISILNNLKIELTKKSYRRREKVSVNIFSPDGQAGNCSVSIRYLMDINEQAQNELFESTIYYEAEPQDSKEHRLIIEGLAMDSDTGVPVISDVLSMYMVNNNNFYRIISKDGRAHVDIEDISGTEKFQIFNMNPYQSVKPDFKLKLSGEKLLGLKDAVDIPFRNKSIITYIKNANMSRKLREIFEGKTNDSLLSKQFVPISFEADKVYKMEKYKSMKTMEEFLKEIVVFANLIKKDGSTTVRLKNTETQRFFMEKPWYLVDGYLTRDEQLVLDIPFKNLTRVEIFNTNKSILGQLETVMIRSGLIAVYTDNYYLKNIIEEEGNIFDFNGFSISKKFVSIAETPTSEARGNPNFKSLLHWNPSVELSSKERIEFVTSDILGDFIIRVEGITEDGQRLSGSEIFSVIY